MEFRDALKRLRGEIGYSQSDIASGLKVTSVTVSRWENGRSLPNRSISTALLNIAVSKAASMETIKALKEAL